MGRDHRGELVDLRDQGDQGGRVVQHLQGHLDFREVQGVPWDHHVRVDQLVLQEDQGGQVHQEDQWLLTVPSDHRVLAVLGVPSAHQYQVDRVVGVEVAEVVVAAAEGEGVELANNMLLGKMEHSDLDSQGDMDLDFFCNDEVVRVSTLTRLRRYK